MREERDALRAEAERLRDDLSRGRVVDRLDVSGVGAVICCDHLGPARPSCEHAGCGLVTLGELVECYSSPHTYAPPTAESARLSARVRELEDALWRCVELTGDDVSDGRPGPGSWPPLHERAIREVERLRRESEEGYDQDIAQARAEGARRERERLAPIVRTLHKIHDHCVGPDCGRGCVLSMQQDATAAFAEVFGSEWTWDALAAVLSDDEGGRDDGD